jgi:hypothetical protein
LPPKGREQDEVKKDEKPSRSHSPPALDAQDRGGIRCPTEEFFGWCQPVSDHILTKLQMFGKVDILYEKYPENC